MKYCNKCEQHKDESEFGCDKQKSDGLNSNCKVCIRKRNEKNRAENIEYNKKYAANYRKENREILRRKARLTFLRDRDKRLNQGRESYYRNRKEIALRRKIKRETPEARSKESARQKEWRNSNPEKYRAYIKKWQQSNKERYNAHQKVHRAIAKGILKRLEYCEICKKICKTEGHHVDYSKSLEVQWLCRLCHAGKITKL